MVKGVNVAELVPAAVPLLSQPTPVSELQFVPCHKVIAGEGSAGAPAVIETVALVPDATKLYQTSNAGEG